MIPGSPVPGRSRYRLRHRFAGAAAALLALGACDPSTTTGSGGGTASRGLPPSTNLHAATGLPPGAVYGVTRSANGWRVLYHGAAASPQAVAQRLCASLGRPAAGVRDERVQGASDLPGARKIEISCA